MIDIRDVERVLERHPWLKPPKNVIIVYDVVEAKHPVYGRLLFRGLQPDWRKDTIVIVSPLATEETVIHEIIHTYGFGERVAHTISPILYSFRKNFGSVIKRRVKYRECTYCEKFKVLHEKYSDKMKHYVLVE